MEPLPAVPVEYGQYTVRDLFGIPIELIVLIVLGVILTVLLKRLKG